MQHFSLRQFAATHRCRIPRVVIHSQRSPTFSSEAATDMLLPQFTPSQDLRIHGGRIGTHSKRRSRVLCFHLCRPPQIPQQPLVGEFRHGLIRPGSLSIKAFPRGGLCPMSHTMWRPGGHTIQKETEGG